MGLIHVLPDLLVNRIAAGEVIERPASAVKELLENSIDAEATRIEVAVEDGGRRLIRVTDNGVGMDAEDVALSVVPHATSKIEREEDLFAIGTMGFRGEALASIGAVSDLRIVSRRRDSDAANEVRVVGDRVEGPKAAAAPPGTTVEVRNLFFNVPARQKFLRTPQTEFGHIVEQVARVALAHPRIEFRVTHNGREVHRLPPVGSLRERIRDLYGSELADGLIAVARSERGLEINGLVSSPAQSRSTGRWEYAFLNGRFIRDRFIQHAVREAYRGLIDPQRYPVTFLMFTIDSSDVDVNVHPTKIEVRWRDSNLVHSATLAALREMFLQRDLSVPVAFKDAGEDDAERRRQQIRQAMADFFKARPAPPVQAPLPLSGARVKGSGFRISGSAPEAPADIERSGTGSRGTAFDSPPGREFRLSTELAAVTRNSAFDTRLPESETPYPSPETRWTEPGTRSPSPVALTQRVMQIHRTYLVTETADGLIIVDQHALHERVLYEQLRAQVSRGPLESQRLLLPETVQVSGEQTDVLETHADLLQMLGLELTAFGRSAIAVHACPTILGSPDVTAFVRDLVDRLSSLPAGVSSEAVLEDLLQMMACKAAVKAGDALSQEEMAALLVQRETVERSSNCPHGRPTTLRLTVEDLERQFKRT